MSLVANSHGSMYNGVSQQPPHMRSPSQCEEMYNINTSLEYGLIRRMPLESPDGAQTSAPSMSMADEDSYSKMIIDGNSVYQININNGTPSVVQVEPYYKVLVVGTGAGYINMPSLAAWYLKQKEGTKYRRSQYSTTTIKNTTIISNDTIIPQTRVDDAPGGNNWEYALVWLKVGDPALGIEYSIVLNGVTYTTDKKNRGGANKVGPEPYDVLDDDLSSIYFPYPQRPSILFNQQTRFDGDLKAVVRSNTSEPVYYTGVHAFVDGWGGGYQWLTSSEISQIQAYRTLLDGRTSALKQMESSKRRRLRLEQYQAKLNSWLAQDVRHPGTTKEAAIELASKIRAAGHTVHLDGSMLAIKMKKSSSSISTYDSYGNNAMSSFYKDIDGIEGLPSKMRYNWVFFRFRVKQEKTYDKVAYWVKWNGKTREETTHDTDTVIIQHTMPVEMRIQFYTNGSIARVDIGLREWDQRKVGDDVTNKGPKFLNRKPIRDIFFYRNRLGFLTDEGVAMTESGDHSNLWRTTAMSSLDSDPIDFVVSTTSSTSLKYTIMNQDKIFILADNVQFVMDGGLVLSPSSVKVQEVSHYVLNLDVSPIVSDNKIIMIGGTDKSTIVYEYAYNQNIGVAEATALTAHVPGYILKDVVCLAASNEDNMIFIVASDHREKLRPHTGGSYFRDMYDDEPYPAPKGFQPLDKYPDRKILYVYKYADSGNERVQSAWSKWNYRGSVLQVAASRGVLFMDIDHEFYGDQTVTIIGTGIWEMSGAWLHDDMNWNMTEDDYMNSVQLQRRFARQALRPPFLEAVTSDFEVSSSVLDDDAIIRLDYKDFGEYINRSYVDLGEFVFKDRASKKYTAGVSKLGAINIKSDPASLHNIIVHNHDTGSAREITPRNNKRFKGAGLAANYFLFETGHVALAGAREVDGDKFDTINILEPVSVAKEFGEKTMRGGSLVGAFDTASIANTDPTYIPPRAENDEMPNLYGIDVPVYIGGRSDSTRVVISSYFDAGRDYGFRIHDIIQEAEINTRFNLS